MGACIPTLALELRLHGNKLGLYDLTNEKWLVTPAEAAASRAEAETVARQQAEAEVIELREEIERLKALTTSSQTNPQEKGNSLKKAY